MNNDFINRLTDIVNANLSNEKFGVEDLVREMGMSHSSLHKKLKSSTNQTISQFIREVRLNKAKEFLLNEDLTASEISYRVGFGSPSYFNKCFHEYFGYAPGELRARETFIRPTEQKPNTLPKRKKRSKLILILIISLISIILLSALVFNKSEKSKTAETSEKSIAVLPFNYLSADQEKQYLANGVMDAILLHLSKIKDLRVVPRTSVEQYRNTNKTAKIIGSEMDVAYLLEGSFLKDGEKARLIVQLIRTSDEDHVWANEYDRDWNDIFSVQSEVAETIATELQAVITPEEKRLIRKIPTTNLTAWDFYQRGNDEIFQDRYVSAPEALTRARHFFLKAIECDSTFAEAYVGLAWVIWNSSLYKTNYFTDFPDSVLTLANRALFYDEQLADAYALRGRCYGETGKINQAIEEYDKAISLDPNNWRAYRAKANVAQTITVNYTDAIYYWHEACSRIRGTMLPTLLRSLARAYLDAGFFDNAELYFQEAFKLDNDSANYLGSIAFKEFCQENFSNAAFLAQKAYAITPRWAPELALYKAMLREDKDLHIYYEKFFERSKINGDIPYNFAHRIGYSYLKIGREEEANYYFKLQMKYDLASRKTRRAYAEGNFVFYQEAAVYSIMGDKVNALKNLEEFNKKKSFASSWVIYLKYDPLLDNIRNEPRFKKILSEAESKYQAEHERVRKWLIKQGKL